MEAAENMAENTKKLHIAVFPWLAFGHMIPYLELSKLIAQKGHKVSFISTPKNINRLPKLPPHLSPFIDFVGFPLPHIEKLPQNAEATTDVPYEQVKYLKIAQDGLQESISKFLQESAPDFILFDFTSYWVPSIAAKFNIPTAYFSIFTAATLGGAIGPVPGPDNHYESRKTPEDYTVTPEWVPFETTIPMKLFEVLRIFDASMKGDDENVSDVVRFYKTLENCDILLLRSCYEFEPEWLKVMEDIHPKTVIPVGQLPTTSYHEDDSKENNAWKEIKPWFDKQEKGKVIYVAFGSEAKPSQTELTEIAFGLELSGLPFFWVLRNKRGESDDELIQLPEGFEERIRKGNMGIVWTSWAPQLKILSHDSVGGFFNHAGWSSVVESIQYEKPLVLLSFSGDQGMIARLLEEKQVAYMIPRDDRNGSFTRDSVAESLRLVVVEEEGKIYRDKVKEMNPLFSDKGRQDHYVENLISHLQNHGKPKT